jgi:hypothetical protein
MINVSSLIDILSSPILLDPGTLDETRNQIGVLRAKYMGFNQFAAIVIAGSVLPLLLLTWIRYARARSGSKPESFLDFAWQSAQKWRWGLCILLVIDAFLIITQTLARGRAVGQWDADGQFLPYHTLVADFARAGRLLSWDPWTNGGLPMAGDPQVGAYSPLNVITGFLMGGSTTAFIGYWLLIWALGAVGMVMLGKRIKAPWWGAAAVALGFSFSGLYTGHAEHTSWIVAFSAMPWIIWRFEAALQTGKLQPGIEAGAIWGLSALGGYPGHAMLTGGFVGLWALGRWLFRESNEGLQNEIAQEIAQDEESTTPQIKRPTLRGSILNLALFLVIGLIVLAPTYLSFFYEGKGAHSRVGTVDRSAAVTEGAFPFGALMTFASPYLPVMKIEYLMKGEPIWPGLDVSMCSLYAGALIPILALFALLVRPRDRWRWWLLFLGLFNLSCAISARLPVRGWLYDWVYPTRYFRHPAIFRVYFILAITALALYGARDLAQTLARQDGRVIKRLVIASMVVAMAAILTLLWFNHYFSSLPPYPNSKGWKVIAASHAMTVWLGAAVVAIFCWKFSAKVRSWGPPALFLALAVGDAFLTCMISLNVIASDGSVERWRQLDRQHSVSIDLTANGLRRNDASSYTPAPQYLFNNDQLINKIPVFAGYVTSTNSFQQRIWEDPVLKSMALGPERIWFAREVAEVPPSENLFVEIRKRAGELNGFPILVHSQQEMLSQAPNAWPQPPTQEMMAQIARLPLAEKLSVKLLKYDPEELSFEVNCPDQGWLLVTDRWARGWRAEINGNPSPIYGGDFIFRAAPVSAGLNRLKFTYHPFGRPWLVVASWSAMALIALAAVGRKLRQR